MKQFSSFLAIVAIALTSVFSFSSCSKDDDPISKPEPTPMPVPAEEFDAYMYVPTTVEQLKYMDATYTLQVDGVKKVVKLSEMADVKGTKYYAAASDLLLQTYKITETEYLKSEAKIFALHLGKVKDVKIESVKYTTSVAKTDYKIDGFIGAVVMSEYGVLTMAYGDVNYFAGLDELACFIDTYNSL